MNYYNFHIGDYISHTIHLSVEEDLAYRRLLDMYYDTELPIPNNIPLVSRKLRINAEVVETVLYEFFELTEDGFKNFRADNEIAEYHKFIEKQKANGRKGGRPKKSQRKPTANPTKSQKKPNQEPLTNNHKPIKPPLPPKGELFDLFWKAYPKKVGKDAAYKAFAKRKPDEQLVKTMIASVRKQADTEQWKKDGGQFIPHASTWLNEGRWQDETEIGAEQDWHLTRKGVESMAERLGLESWNQMCQFDQYRNTVLRTATERGMA
jgi:uncharacterized protein YdaU (DUF1376 family)